MLKINAVWCRAGYIQVFLCWWWNNFMPHLCSLRSGNILDSSWYVVEEGGLLHPVLLAHLVVVEEVAGAPLHRPGLGVRRITVRVWARERDIYTWYLIQSVTLPDLIMSAWCPLVPPLLLLAVSCCCCRPSALPHSLSQSPTSRPGWRSSNYVHWARGYSRSRITMLLSSTSQVKCPHYCVSNSKAWATWESQSCHIKASSQQCFTW